jgi:GT2 family glycosyltransferase
VSELSIVIPTLGRSESLTDVLTGLAAQQPAVTDVEVLVAVDADGEAPELPDQAGALPVRVLRAGCPGASGARNAGWRAASAPLILFLDDDIVPGRRLLAEHLAWHRSRPDVEVGVLGDVRWASSVKVTPFMRWLEMGIQFDYFRIEGVELDWTRFYSCNASVKRALLERVGGFDEQRFPYGYEDLELARRLSEHGFRLLYNRAAAAEHLKTETLDGWRRNLRRIAVSERRFTTLYPEERPYFYEHFRSAAIAPRAQGRSARLVRVVPPRTPVLGRVVWDSYDMLCRQQLADEFLAEWEAAG